MGCVAHRSNCHAPSNVIRPFANIGMHGAHADVHATHRGSRLWPANGLIANRSPRPFKTRVIGTSTARRAGCAGRNPRPMLSVLLASGVARSPRAFRPAQPALRRGFPHPPIPDRTRHAVSLRGNWASPVGDHRGHSRLMCYIAERHCRELKRHQSRISSPRRSHAPNVLRRRGQ